MKITIELDRMDLHPIFIIGYDRYPNLKEENISIGNFSDGCRKLIEISDEAWYINDDFKKKIK